MNSSILETDVQTFITNHLGSDTIRILLGKSPFKNVSTRELVAQIESKKRCEKKLPLWYSTPGIYYPPKISIEQASSQATAKYKAQLIKGEHVLDATGGFGVDSYYFSLYAQRVVHCEINEVLSTIVRQNAETLHAKHLFCYVGDGMTYLQNSNEQFDTIYIDPSRRLNTHKVFKITDCEPDVKANLDLLTKKHARVIIKTSPLLDIKSGLADLKNVREIHVVSVKNDCKELLWIIDPDFKGDEPLIYCAAIDDKENTSSYSFNLSEEKIAPNPTSSKPLSFIYEPDVSLLKAGCFKLITKKFDVFKLHQHTHLYTSETLNTDFIGKKFKLKTSWDYRTFINKKPVKQANIISRNFPLSVEELKKRHQLEDGGHCYLLFTTAYENQLIVLHCERI